MPLKVLVADDQKMTRMMVEKLLTDRGCDVTTVSDGRQAIAFAKEEAYDLIITDIMMPEIEGIEVVSEVINENIDVKVIAMTSEGNVGHTSFLKIAETHGASGSIRKPFTPEELIEKIKEVGLTMPDGK
ncbi:MAG: response regulator [Alcanivorax sp.]